MIRTPEIIIFGVLVAFTVQLLIYKFNVDDNDI